MKAVRAATQADVGAIVRLHLAAFEGFFLTQLGGRFLQELYEGFLRDPSGILLLAETNGEALGFAAGTVTPEGFFGRLLRRRGMKFALTALGAFVRSPVMVGRRLARGLIYRGEKPPSLVEAALLSSVGVHPAQKGAGLGRLLVESFCAEARQRGCRWVYLTTDRDDNRSTNGFYLAVGFHLESEVARPGGRWMNRYVRAL